MKSRDKRAIISVMLRSGRRDLANAVARLAVAEEKYQARGPLEKMIGEISLQETGKWLDEAGMKAIVQKIDELGIQEEDLDEDAYDEITQVVVDYNADNEIDTPHEPHEVNESTLAHQIRSAAPQDQVYGAYKKLMNLAVQEMDYHVLTRQQINALRKFLQKLLNINEF